MPVTNYYTIDGSIVAEATGGVRTDYLTDALGSVTATVDSSGNLLNTYRYKPYGEQLAKTGAAADPKFTWVGTLGYRQAGRKHSDTYVRARHYGSSAGRWTTKDPLGYDAGDWTLYRYVYNKPIDWIDPSGKKPPMKEPPYYGHYISDQWEWILTGHPNYLDCIVDAIDKQPKGAPTIDTNKLFAYTWCIINGESSWNPGSRNKVVKKPEKWTGDPGLIGQYACGFMQLVGYYNGNFCQDKGYPDWKTNPCSNIGCGVSLLSDCLALNKGDIRKCGNKFNAIREPGFNQCLSINFGVKS